MEREESEFCVYIGNPPSVEPGAVGSCKPDVFGGKRAWMPVAFEAARVVGEENHAMLEETSDDQQEHIGYKNVEQKHG